MTKCNRTANLKDIIGSFTPFLIAVAAQYIINFIDVAILFLHNLRSDEKTTSSVSIGTIMQLDYNQPMNQAYLVLAQHLFFLICFGIWYMRIFYKEKLSAGEKFSPKQTFLSIRVIYFLLAGVLIQIMVDGILTLVSPLFPKTFDAYYKLISNVSGMNVTVPMVLASYVIAPIGEELFFRGVIMGYAKRYMPAACAIVFQGILFGLYHGNIVQGIYASILGCVLGYVAHRTNNLAYSMLLHFSINISLLFIPSAWFTQTARCIVLVCISLFVSTLFLILATRHEKKKKQ